MTKTEVLPTFNFPAVDFSNKLITAPFYPRNQKPANFKICDVMSCFAAGERYLNRVWSASADGYIDEVNAYLDRALEQFTDSHQKVRQLKTNTLPPV